LGIRYVDQDGLESSYRIETVWIERHSLVSSVAMSVQGRKLAGAARVVISTKPWVHFMLEESRVPIPRVFKVKEARLT
jgi:hypothetical protein